MCCQVPKTRQHRRPVSLPVTVAECRGGPIHGAELVKSSLSMGLTLLLFLQMCRALDSTSLKA
jgi:hypothetical protein